MELRSYQNEAVQAITKARDSGIGSGLVVLPTGTGKTVVFSYLVHQERENRANESTAQESYKTLILAHREELLLQARDKLQSIDPGVVVGIEQAENYADHEGDDVVVASVATLGRDGSDRISRFSPDYFDLIIIDEAHHAAAPSYRRILDYFSSAFHLGVTATPQRGDNTRLTDVFEEIIYFKDILEMIEDDFLCNLVGYRVGTDSDLGDVKIQNGDYVASQLTEAIDTSERNSLVVDCYDKFAPGRKTLTFAASVEHAEHLANTFQKRGVACDYVVGTTSSENRSRILGDFSSGKIQVVVNVGVLTEGFDEPEVGCIILARPTRSHLLYTQIVGRGTRIAEGKDDCVIIDLADATKGKKPVGLPTLLGLPPEFDLEGGDLVEAAKEFKKLEETAPAEAARAKNVKDFELAYKRIDLFMPPPPSATVQEYSRLIWTEVGEGNFWLNINGSQSLHIERNSLGSYYVILKEQRKTERTLGICNDAQEAFSRSDKWVQNNHAEDIKLLDSGEAWRDDSPTDKQLKYLRRIGIPITDELTKGMASMIISKYVAENPRSQAQQYMINKNKKAKSW